MGRKVLIRETKVIKLGAYPDWSLGTDRGSFSDDGLTLSGSGRDGWGDYDWDVTKVESGE